MHSYIEIHFCYKPTILSTTTTMMTVFKLTISAILFVSFAFAVKQWYKTIAYICKLFLIKPNENIYTSSFHSSQFMEILDIETYFNNVIYSIFGWRYRIISNDALFLLSVCKTTFELLLKLLAHFAFYYLFATYYQ